MAPALPRSVRRYIRLCAFLALATVVSAVDDCSSEPPCAATPESMQGSFDGVVYDPDIGGQMYATQNDLCAHVNDEVVYYSSVDLLQTVVTVERVGGVEMLVIFMASFKVPEQWDGGAELVVLSDTARWSARTGQPIPFDGFNAVGYYWTRGFWAGASPQYMTASGEIRFTMATGVPESPISAEFSAGLEPAP